jgi:hypothetical protein
VLEDVRERRLVFGWKGMVAAAWSMLLCVWYRFRRGLDIGYLRFTASQQSIADCGAKIPGNTNLRPSLLTGSHVVVTLLLSGKYLPVVVDNFHNSKPHAIQACEEIALEALG